MTNLKDYLSSLVSGINQARMLADFESARIAQIYAQDELLKTFSVPRFRLPDVELTVPIAVEELGKEDQTDYQPIDNRSFASHTYQVLKDVMKVDSFSREQSSQIRGMIARETDQLEKAIKAKGSIDNELEFFTKNISGSFSNMVKDDKSPKQEMNTKFSPREDIPLLEREVIMNKLKDRLRPEIKTQEQTQVIANTKIVAEAHRLREMDPKSIIQIKMKLSEEGMEWTKIDKEDGTNEFKLMPE